MTTLYYLAHDSTAFYLWATDGPCVAILPHDPKRPGEAETLAKKLLATANSPNERSDEGGA